MTKEQICEGLLSIRYTGETLKAVLKDMQCDIMEIQFDGSEAENLLQTCNWFREYSTALYMNINSIMLNAEHLRDSIRQIDVAPDSDIVYTDKTKKIVKPHKEVTDEPDGM